jgi:ABC-2 type transport system ATP-binding protein
VSHTYDGARDALHQVDLDIGRGEIFALVGPNGAGKSTLLRILATLQVATRGAVLIDGCDARTQQAEVRRRVGYLPDHFSLYEDLTPVQLLSFFGRCHGMPEDEIRARVDELLEQLDLGQKRHGPVGGLSRGMKQRLGIAKTLMHRPRLVLLDEPASGLDPLARGSLWQLIARLKGEGTTFIISSHVLSELAGLCTSVGILEQGRLLRHGPLGEFLDEGLAVAQRFRLRFLGSWDKAQGVLGEAGVPYTRLSGREIEVEIAGEERLAGLIEALVLRGVRVSAATPAESQLEAMYRASARGEVA